MNEIELLQEYTVLHLQNKAHGKQILESRAIIDVNQKRCREIAGQFLRSVMEDRSTRAYAVSKTQVAVVHWDNDECVPNITIAELETPCTS